MLDDDLGRSWPGDMRWGALDAVLVFAAGVLVARALGGLLPAGMGPRVLLKVAMHGTFLAGVVVVARRRGYTAAGLGWRWRPFPSVSATLALVRLWLGVLAVDLAVAAASVAVLGVGPERLAGQLADHAAGVGGALLVADVTLTAVVAPLTEELRVPAPGDLDQADEALGPEAVPARVQRVVLAQSGRPTPAAGSTRPARR